MKWGIRKGGIYKKSKLDKGLRMNLQLFAKKRKFRFQNSKEAAIVTSALRNWISKEDRKKECFI